MAISRTEFNAGKKGASLEQPIITFLTAHQNEAFGFYELQGSVFPGLPRPYFTEAINRLITTGKIEKELITYNGSELWFLALKI